MNEILKQRLLRRLELLPDERGYQVLDYVEFLESKYAERAAPAGFLAKSVLRLDGPHDSGRSRAT